MQCDHALNDSVALLRLSLIPRRINLCHDIFFILREIRPKKVFLVTGGLLDFGRHDILFLISLLDTVIKEGFKCEIVLSSTPNNNPF